LIMPGLLFASTCFGQCTVVTEFDQETITEARSGNPMSVQRNEFWVGRLRDFIALEPAGRCETLARQRLIAHFFSLKREADAKTLAVESMDQATDSGRRTQFANYAVAAIERQHITVARGSISIAPAAVSEAAEIAGRAVAGLGTLEQIDDSGDDFVLSNIVPLRNVLASAQPTADAKLAALNALAEECAAVDARRVQRGKDPMFGFDLNGLVEGIIQGLKGREPAPTTAEIFAAISRLPSIAQGSEVTSRFEARLVREVSDPSNPVTLRRELANLARAGNISALGRAQLDYALLMDRDQRARAGSATVVEDQLVATDAAALWQFMRQSEATIPQDAESQRTWTVINRGVLVAQFDAVWRRARDCNAARAIATEFSTRFPNTVDASNMLTKISDCR
jgi:hypothetical protein